MAINGISGTESLLNSALDSLTGTALRRASIQPQTATTLETPATATPAGNTFSQNIAPIAIPAQNINTQPAAAPVTAAAPNVLQPSKIAQPTVPLPIANLPNAGITKPVPAPPVLQAVTIIPPPPLQAAIATNNTATIPPTPAEAPVIIAPPPTAAVQTTVQPNALQLAVPLQNITAPPPAALPVASAAPTAIATPAAPASVLPATALAPSPTALQTAVTPAALPTTAPAAELPPTALEAIQQNAQLVNTTLQNLGQTATVPTVENLFFTTPSPLLTALQQTQELTPAQQNALLVNETLQNLNFVPAAPLNPLLVNELPPTLAAAEITENLNLVQQNAQVVNETLLQVGPATPPGVVQQPQALPVAPAAAPQITPVAAAAPPAATAIAPAATATASITTAATTTTTTTAVTIPVTVQFPTQGFSPATFQLTLFPDRTPYVLVVYQPNDPAPLPHDPAPVDREVPPADPVVPTPRTGEARLRQLHLPQGGSLRRTDYYTSQATVGQAEKSIRYSIGQVNAEMAAQGSSLHLVFARHENGFAVDVYDCSYNEACRLAYDVPIPLDNLPGVLGNLQHETGIIVDTAS